MPAPIINDTPNLPSMVAGASDPLIVAMQNKLSKQGVRIITVGQMYLISIPSSLLFANQSPKLNWNAYELLGNVACYLQQFRKVSVHVNAYSSCYLSEQRTKSLTLARARTVGNYLWSQNMETRMVFTHGMGDDKPIVSATQCVDLSPNSRIEIVFRRAVA